MVGARIRVRVGARGRVRVGARVEVSTTSASTPKAIVEFITTSASTPKAVVEFSTTSASTPKAVVEFCWSGPRLSPATHVIGKGVGVAVKKVNYIQVDRGGADANFKRMDCKIQTLITYGHNVSEFRHFR